jgi:hypothetical protein
MSTSKKTTDHTEIRSWAESRGAEPALVKETNSHYDMGVLRINVPGSKAHGRVEPLSWDSFFKRFDEDGLAFMYAPEAHDTDGAKLVRREGYHRGL